MCLKSIPDKAYNSKLRNLLSVGHRSKKPGPKISSTWLNKLTLLCHNRGNYYPHSLS